MFSQDKRRRRGVVEDIHPAYRKSVRNVFMNKGLLDRLALVHFFLAIKFVDSRKHASFHNGDTVTHKSTLLYFSRCRWLRVTASRRD